MSDTLGMNPARVRAKAAELRAQLAVLDNAASTVRAAANASLNPLSYGIQPGGFVIAPFAIAGTQIAASKISAASGSIHELIEKLMNEAHQQEIVSESSNKSYLQAYVPKVGAVSRPRTSIDVFSLIRNGWNAYSSVKDVVQSAKFVSALSFIATSVRNPSSINALMSARHFSAGYKFFDKVGQVMEGAGKVGKVLGWVGVGFGVINTVEAAMNGDTGKAIWEGAKTGLAIAALVTPPPVNLILGGVSVAIGIGELVYQNREAIAKTAQAVGDTVSKVAQGIAEGAANVGKGIADAAKKLWPF